MEMIEAREAQCKEVPVEEYEVLVVEASSRTVHARLRFALLDSTRLPRVVGVILWSILHIILVVYVPLMLLGVFAFAIAFAVVVDVWLTVCARLFSPLLIVISFLGLLLCTIPLGAVAVLLDRIWLVVSCQCSTLPARARGQGVADYLFPVGGKPRWVYKVRREPAAAAAANDRGRSPGIVIREMVCATPFVTVLLCKHVVTVSFPDWRGHVEGWCREIVPSYDAIAI